MLLDVQPLFGGRIFYLKGSGVAGAKSFYESFAAGATDPTLADAWAVIDGEQFHYLLSGKYKYCQAILSRRLVRLCIKRLWQWKILIKRQRLEGT